MMRIPHLSAFLGGRELVPPRAGDFVAVVGWGDKPSGRAARTLARTRDVPFALLEDGFIRSVGLGKSGAPPVSIVLDDSGIYFNASAPSRLEKLMMNPAWITDDIKSAAAAGMARWQDERLTKYNLVSGLEGERTAAKRIVLVDQVVGDASISGSLASAGTFKLMFDRALEEHGAAACAVKSHPDVVAGKARGYLLSMARNAGVTVVDASMSPHAVIDVAEEIWTVSSGLGFEALLRGIPVVTFGVSFYAGYGLTRDEAVDMIAKAALLRRQQPQTRLTTFAATFIAYSRYADPVTRRPLTLDGAMDRLIDWRRRTGELAAGKTISYGFSRWKRTSAAVFLGGQCSQIVFDGKPKLGRLERMIRRSQPARIALWGVVDPPGFENAARRHGCGFVRVEDGFIRSVGLGSDLRSAGSLVLDDAGIYYDASRPSYLETLISQGPFPSGLIDRAKRLRERLAESGITKYNLGSAKIDLAAAARGRPVILVAEQVPGDNALRLGSLQIKTSLALLAAVRADRPGCFIVYKEHPDLVAGNRPGRASPRMLADNADLVVSAGDLADLYGAIDELHVISSLAGFEALCRNVRVVVWGRPFYGGWGLTDDRVAFDRRNRHVTLDELVAATLILYPRYIDPVCSVPCSVEDFLDCLDDIRAKRGPGRPVGRSIGRQLRRFRRWLGLG